jgi:hypothetical protein
MRNKNTGSSNSASQERNKQRKRKKSIGGSHGFTTQLHRIDRVAPAQLCPFGFEIFAFRQQIAIPNGPNRNADKTLGMETQSNAKRNSQINAQ